MATHLKAPCRLIVKDLDSEERIDLYLSHKVESTSRSQIKALIQRGMVKLNGKPCLHKTLVKEGDCIEILEALVPKNKITLKPSALKLDILFEDKDLIVVNKPSGISTHPSLSDHGHGNTLVEALLTHTHKESLWRAGENSERPGVVHRLDKNTTGALVWAKNLKSLEGLQKQFKEKSNKRQYWTLLEGELAKEISFESYLKRDPQNKLRFSSSEREDLGGKWAKSFFKPLESFSGKYTLCAVTLHTGRTHQIRVHAKALGHPVLGDPLYNLKKTVSKIFNPSTRSLIEGLTRQMLHAKTLGFEHPITKEMMSFEAPLPEDFSSLLTELKNYSS